MAGSKPFPVKFSRFPRLDESNSMYRLKLPAIHLAWYRYLLHYPAQFALAIMGISLGVAVIVSIGLAKDSAMEAFVQATRTISGKASYRIVGQSGTIEESLYVRLRLDNLAFRLIPRIEGYVQPENQPGEKIRLIGIDPFAETGFGSIEALASASFSEEGPSTIARIMTRPGHVALSENTAKRLQLKAGEDLLVSIGKERKLLRVATVLKFSDRLMQQAMEDLILTDIGSAQELLGQVGRISRIDVIAPEPDTSPTAVQQLEQRLPETTALISYQSLTRNAQDLTDSFYTNLTALSLLSLLVGMFLIYNTVNFLTLRRQPLTATLRAIGASRHQIFMLVISETALLGFIGTLIGLWLGTLFAHGLLELIANTIDNVYFPLPSPILTIPFTSLAQGLMIGTIVSVASALPPAATAMQTEPAQACLRSRLESRTRKQVVRSGGIGILSVATGSLTIFASGTSVAYGFAGLMLLVLGCALLTPSLLMAFSRFAYPTVVRMFGVVVALPLRALDANISRTGFAVAALMVAISTAVGIQIMVASFRYSVSDWLENRLDADFYVSAGQGSVMNHAPLDEGDLARISGIDSVGAVGSVLRYTLQRPEAQDRFRVYQLTARGRHGFDFIAVQPDGVWQDFSHQDTVIVTESYAFYHHLKVGSSLPLATRQGMQEFRVIGIYTDYNPGQGLIGISRSTFQRHWHTEGFSVFSVYMKPGSDPGHLKRQLQALNTPTRIINVTEQARVVKVSMAVFDQAFAVTRILQWLATAIAVLGVFSVLSAIQLDRVYEYGVLRSIGITSQQLGSLVCLESALMGGFAGLLALPVGTMTSGILIYVINRRSFGWSMDFELPVEIVAQGLAGGILAAVLAGLVPAYRMTRLLPAEALRNNRG